MYDLRRAGLSDMDFVIQVYFSERKVNISQNSSESPSIVYCRYIPALELNFSSFISILLTEIL
jgi:hypothetical protein